MKDFTKEMLFYLLSVTFIIAELTDIVSLAVCIIRKSTPVFIANIKHKLVKLELSITY
jgi:hypothetical protein